MMRAFYLTGPCGAVAWSLLAVTLTGSGCSSTGPKVIGGSGAAVGAGAEASATGGADPGAGAAPAQATGGNTGATGVGAAVSTGGDPSAITVGSGGSYNPGTGGVVTGATGGAMEPVGPLGSVCANLPSYTGNGSATWYQFAQGSSEVNCSFPILSSAPMGSTGDRVGGISTGNGEYFLALNTADYDSAAMCGGCIEVTRGDGRSVVATVVDHCPSATNPNCKPGHVDLSRAAYAELADVSTETGFLGTGNGGSADTISWRFVECPVGSSDIKVRFKEPDNLYWNEILIQNTRYPVAKVEAMVTGTWVQTQRQSYNYFTPTGSPVGDLGQSPYQVRVTDVNGAAVTLSVALGSGDVPTGQQLPACQ